MTQISPQRLLELRIDALSTEEFICRIVDLAKQGKNGYCCITNVHSCITARTNTRFRTAIENATYAIPDSTILQWAYSLRFRIKPIRAAHGAELMTRLGHVAASAKIPIGFYGGKNDQLLDQLRANIMKSSPGLKVGYAFAPPFRELSESEMDKIIDELNASNVGIVFVGIGCPKQELWMAEHSHKISAILVGVGAAFDMNSGNITLSPTWAHKCGLEWLFRLVREPKRLWQRYLTTCPVFLWLFLNDLVSAFCRKSLNSHKNE